MTSSPGDTLYRVAELLFRPLPLLLFCFNQCLPVAVFYMATKAILHHRTEWNETEQLSSSFVNTQHCA